MGCGPALQEMIQAYREFGPDLIFIDVLTRVVAADINAPETGMRVMQAVYALAAPFGATVVIAHHPGLNSSGRPMGSSPLFEPPAFGLPPDPRLN